jgi:hypothetical protein
MSMNRIDQYPGRGSGSSCRDQKNPANVTAAAASQMTTPTARTHGVDPGRPENIENRARQPVLWVPPTAPESAISLLRPTTERRARTTAIAIQPAAQNGTSGALAICKHSRRRAARGTQ